MVEAVTIIALALLVAGVVGTLVPLVPGGVFSLSGLLVYWWHSGFSEPGLLWMVVLGSLAVFTLLVEFLGGSIAAKAGGASWATTAAAAVVGIALMILTGPLGLLVGLFGTVFALEYARDGDLDGSVRSAGYATVGILASTAVQVLLTLSILLGFVVAVFIL